MVKVSVVKSFKEGASEKKPPCIRLTWDSALLLPPASDDPPKKEGNAEQAGRHQQLRQHHHDLTSPLLLRPLTLFFTRKSRTITRAQLAREAWDSVVHPVQVGQ